ncbi:Decaprenyl-diphosphate synthase subunit 2 [Schistosoma japonicum]|nr:Decaprenyl-diphosphate synthase subunit 2 [Schistosoma japonicum]KAH8862758.1 Decaprenyl-diphosphate synthase subunit 2 [Schistosoma japonicum]KAH8862759.1 Decaprenyl-diphosphate synthase subunit 2 [Schistosoma japonicum]
MTTTWSKLICRAEKLLGGPAPFINLSSILSSEAGSLASRARRLAGNVDHPFFSTVRSCLRGKSVNNLFSISSTLSDRFSASVTSERPSGGLIVLLVGQSYTSPTNSTKLYNQHRSISEIFETVHTAVAIHKSLVDLNDLHQNTGDNDESWLKNMEICNKLATLSGDVLLASVSTSLAELHHDKVVDVISEAIGNMIEAEFHELATNANLETININSVVTSDELYSSPKEKWLSFVQLSRGALLGSCCEAALHLTEKHITNLSAIPTDKIYPDWNNLSSIVKRFGSTWACLTRLTEEREHIQRTWSTDQTADAYWSTKKEMRCSKRNIFAYHPSVIPHYSEFGLNEPTFADALLTSLSLSRTRYKLIDVIDKILSEYNQIGCELAEKLREYFTLIVLNSEQCSTYSYSNPYHTQKTTKYSPSTELLGEMVDKLISDCNCSP